MPHFVIMKGKKCNAKGEATSYKGGYSGWAIYSNCLTSFLGVANMYIYNTKVVDSGQL